MTTYAPPFTSRWRGKYIAGGIQHTIQFRGARGATFATMDGYKDRAREVFTGVAAYLFSDFSWVSAEVALTDDEEFAPATTPSVGTPGAVDPADVSAVAKIKGLTFAGSALGSRGKFTIFGCFFPSEAAGDFGGNGVITPAEFGGISTVVGVANTYFYANSGSLARWHSRATYKENDHLLALVRRGTIS